MQIFPEGIVESRKAKLDGRLESLERSEQGLSTGLVGPVLVELYFLSAFAAGVVVDTVKSGLHRKPEQEVVRSEEQQ